MIINQEYADELRASLPATAFIDEAAFRRHVQVDVNAGWAAEVNHVGRSLFGASFTAFPMSALLGASAQDGRRK